jgi:hypothetical protein
MLRTQALKARTLNLTVPKNRKVRTISLMSAAPHPLASAGFLSMNTYEKLIRASQPKFDLNNIPLVVGTAFVKWHLPSSTAAEHRGRTERAPITDHRCIWDYTKELTIRMTIDKSLLLSETEIHFEILQEYSEGARDGRVVLGQVKLNLAEYADRSHLDNDSAALDPDDEGITRRYLMQQSKINSTLKIGIQLKQLDGDTNFTTPHLKSAMVFGGIAGIVSAEAGIEDNEGMGHMPTITSKTRELSELQDIYRRTLAATWACQAGELPPDKLIEDLFSGGDGGRMQPPQPNPTSRWRRGATEIVRPHSRDASGGSSSDTESRRTVTPTHHTPNSTIDSEIFGPAHRRSLRNPSVDDSFTMTGSAGHHSHVGSISGRGSIDQQIQQDHGRRRTNSNYKEYSEFQLRENLMSWSVDPSHVQETVSTALKAS